MKNDKIKKPKAAFILVLLGGIFVLLGGVVLVAGAQILGMYTALDTADFFMSGILGIVTGIILIVSSAMLRSASKPRVKAWSIVALAVGIVSIASTGGFLVGFVLTLVGSVVGLLRSRKG
jgi:chromate transport protein ChrA